MVIMKDHISDFIKISACVKDFVSSHNYTTTLCIKEGALQRWLGEMNHLMCPLCNPTFPISKRKIKIRSNLFSLLKRFTGPSELSPANVLVSVCRHIELLEKIFFRKKTFSVGRSGSQCEIPKRWIVWDLQKATRNTFQRMFKSLLTQPRITRKIYCHSVQYHLQTEN